MKNTLYIFLLSRLYAGLIQPAHQMLKNFLIKQYIKFPINTILICPILTNNFNWVYSSDLYGRVQNNYITPYFTNINSGSLNYEAYPYYLMGSEASGGRSMQGSGWYKIKE